jgi:hypothetical protein
MRLGITASPSEIFPGGKVKYFLWKCEILLTQCDICLRHVKVSLRDDLNIKKEFRTNAEFLFSFTFSIEKISQAKPISHAARRISQLCFGKAISLCDGHIPMPITLTSCVFWFCGEFITFYGNGFL